MAVARLGKESCWWLEKEKKSKEKEGERKKTMVRGISIVLRQRREGLGFVGGRGGRGKERKEEGMVPLRALVGSVTSMPRRLSH